jgi:hypothetical protein
MCEVHPRPIGEDAPEAGAGWIGVCRLDERWVGDQVATSTGAHGGVVMILVLSSGRIVVACVATDGAVDPAAGISLPLVRMKR